MLQKIIKVLLLGMVFLCSCSGNLEHQLQTQADVVKFNQLFDNNFHQSGYLGGIGGGQSSISSSIIYDRYVVKLIFDVQKHKGKYIKRSESKIVVWEYTNQRSNGTPRSLTCMIIGRLNEAQWASINSIDDLFKIAEIEPKKNSPFAELRNRPPKSW